MAHVDNLALANKKNLVGKSKLESEIHRINREKRTVMRLLNNEKQRFKNKYAKFDIFPENRGTEPSDVVMYETHNPGFCYRRNGECRMPQCPIKSTALAFEDIHVLTFTDGELDIDKLLCLHLLSIHRTETLTPPTKSQRNMLCTARHQLPLQRLLERTKKRWPEDRLTRLLPTYVIDYCRSDTCNKSYNVIRDGRLAARLIVNEKINTLIRSVMMTLDRSNQALLTELIEKSRDEDYLKFMLNKPKMQDFCKSLNGLNVISCCESFCLTLPFRIIPIILDVRTPSGQLENLVRQIRKNIFKLPINCCWDEEYTNFSICSDSDNNSSNLLMSSFRGEKEIYSQNLEAADFRSKRFETSVETSNSEAGTNPKVFDESDTESLNSPKSAAKNVIMARKRSPFGMKSSEKSKDDENFKKTLNLHHMKAMDFEKVANLLYRKANGAIKKDMEDLKKDKNKDNKTQVLKNTSNVIPAVNENRNQKPPQKVILKQTKCAACCEKWKQPLPSPKTSHINKYVGGALDEAALQEMESNSSHFLSLLIDKELKYWKNYKISRYDSNRSTLSSSMSPSSSFDKNGIIEIIDLNELDLAKIRQEIREHETRKKLRQFLDS